MTGKIPVVRAVKDAKGGKEAVSWEVLLRSENKLIRAGRPDGRVMLSHRRKGWVVSSTQG